jgi:hypothetical protein
MPTLGFICLIFKQISVIKELKSPCAKKNFDLLFLFANFVALQQSSDGKKQ